MGVLLKMRSIFSPHHFWDTANMNLNINLNTNLNRNFNFRNFCYDNICLQTSILTWELTKWPHKPTEKLGQWRKICTFLIPPTSSCQRGLWKSPLQERLLRAWLSMLKRHPEENFAWKANTKRQKPSRTSNLFCTLD